jgi:hypothetical protein
MPAIGGAGLNYKGTYSSTTAYNVNDSVQFGGSTYVALVANTNVAPTTGVSSATWGLAALGGSSGALSTTTKTAAYTAVANDFVLANATSGAFNVTLPSSPVANTIVAVRKIDYYSNVVTVVSPGPVIDVTVASTTYPLVGRDQTAEFVFDGTVWRVTRTSESVKLPPATPLINGCWYNNSINGAWTNGTSALSVGYVTFMPFYFSRAALVTNLSVYVQGTSSSQIRLGVFTMSLTTGQPTTVLSDFGLVTPSTAGRVSISSTTTVINGGWMYFAIGLPSGTSPTLLTTPSSYPLPNVNAFSYNGGSYCTVQTDTTNGFSTVASATNIVGGNVPLVYFQVAG